MQPWNEHFLLNTENAVTANDRAIITAQCVNGIRSRYGKTEESNKVKKLEELKILYLFLNSRNS